MALSLEVAYTSGPEGVFPTAMPRAPIPCPVAPKLQEGTSAGWAEAAAEVATTRRIGTRGAQKPVGEGQETSFRSPGL